LIIIEKKHTPLNKYVPVEEPLKELWADNVDAGSSSCPRCQTSAKQQTLLLRDGQNEGSV